MELHEYPRPANDTGIGVHWSAGNAVAGGLNKIRTFWLPELKALGVKWVKIYQHDGAHEFAELLLAEEIMPVVRIFRPHPNPGRLTVKDLVDVDSLVRIGVRYFEFNNEPDRDAEWRGGRVPANGIDLAVEDAIADMEAILERGGMPAVPAVSSGSRWDLVGKIVEKGRRDLFDGPVWQALHNYSCNRPLDYPYDAGNQEGAAYTQRFYDALRNEQPGVDPWNGRTLAQVNQMRRDYANPGAAPRDDAMCLLAHEFVDARNRQHLGRSIPLLSTENGYFVGEYLDPRYAATTPDLHMAQTLEICRTMMGTSRRFPAAPDYYFCTAFMLLANQQLGNASSWWEQHAWYSERWPGGALPIVKALRAEPKALRRWQNREAVGARITLHGSVANARDALTLVLDRNGEEQARVQLDPYHRYQFPDLVPGTYVVRIEDTDVMETVTLNQERPEAVLNLEVPAARLGPEESSVRGVVRGGADAVVLLVRISDGEEWVAMAREDGTFRFVDLPPGSYSARVYPRGTHMETVSLDGENEVEIELAVDGWGHTVHYQPDAEMRTAVRCEVEGHKALSVHARCGEWHSESVATGSAPEHGEFACEIDLAGMEPAEAGEDAGETPEMAQSCTVVVEGVVDENGEPVPLRAHVDVEPGRIPFVRFQYIRPNEAESARQSSITGRLLGAYADASAFQLVLTDEGANQRHVAVDETGAFAFTDLRAGLYSVALAGYEQTANRSDIGLDGQNSVYVELQVPASAQRAMPVEPEAEGTVPEETTHTGPAESVIVVHLPGEAGKAAHLTDRQGHRRVEWVSEAGQARFEDLPAEVYALTVEGGYAQEQLRVDGSEGLEVYLMPLHNRWSHEVTRGGSMPGFSAIRVEVLGKYDLPVYLSRPPEEEWDGLMKLTSSRPALGDFALEFSPLEPGHYFVEPRGLDAVAEVELAELEAVWVSFWEETVPTTPNVVVPLGTDPDEIASETFGESLNEIEEGTEEPAEPSQPEEAAQDAWAEHDAPDASEPVSEPMPFTEIEPEVPLEPDPTDPVSASLTRATEYPATELSAAETAEPPESPTVESPAPQTEDTVNEWPESTAKSEPATSATADVATTPPEIEAENALAESDDAGAEPHRDRDDDPDGDRNTGEPEQSSQYLYVNIPSDPASAQVVRELIAVLRYVAVAQPRIGSDASAAAAADEVIVVGDVDAGVAEQLQAEGAHVEHVSDNIVHAFRWLQQQSARDDSHGASPPSENLDGDE